MPDVAEWGSGFDGTRTKRAWAPLAVTRCLDQAALAPLVLDTVEQIVGPGTQFGITCGAIQVHPGQQAQVLHYDQAITRSPATATMMITALWALDDFTADNGATRIVPGSHLRPSRTRPRPCLRRWPPDRSCCSPARLYHGAGAANVTGRPRLGVVIDDVQPWLRPCEAHTLSASHAQVRQLPQRLQELLGFNQPSPYLGFVNGRIPGNGS